MTTVTALDALNRARQAWEATQPQHVLDLYPDALSQADVAASPLGFPHVGLTERARTEGQANRPRRLRNLPGSDGSVATAGTQPAPGSGAPTRSTF